MENKEQIIIRGYPIPPSDNDLKMPVRRYAKGKKFKILTFCDSKKYLSYKSDLNVWWMGNNQTYHDDFMLIRKWLMQGKVLHLEAQFRMHRGRIWTLENKPQRIDAANRLKALQDTLAHLIQIDDTVFFKVTIEKTEIPKDRRECMYITITPIEPRKDL